MNRSNEAQSITGFKEGLLELLRLTRHACGAETAHFQWVNRSREQFVLACVDSRLRTVAFPDRESFEGHWMRPHTDLVHPLDLAIPEQVDPESLTHHHNRPTVFRIRLIPIRNRGETIALAAFEFSRNPTGGDDVFESFQRAHANLLQTHLHLSGLMAVEDSWETYDHKLDQALESPSAVDAIRSSLDLMAESMPTGGASFLARGNGSWVQLFWSRGSARPVAPPGASVFDRSLAYQVLQSGMPEYATHINRSPLRLSTMEPATEGATFGLPLMVDGRRHGVFLAYDVDPLHFTGAACHRLLNIVRALSLKIGAERDVQLLEHDLLAGANTAFNREAWEASLKQALADPSIGIEDGTAAYPHVWCGMATIANLPALRSRLRPVELLSLQTRLITRIAPTKTGFSGWLGSHADYMYSFLLCGPASDSLERWMERIRAALADPLEIGAGKSIQVNVQLLFTPLAEARRIAGSESGFSKLTDRLRMGMNGISEQDRTEAVPLSF